MTSCSEYSEHLHESTGRLQSSVECTALEKKITDLESCGNKLREIMLLNCKGAKKEKEGRPWRELMEICNREQPSKQVSSSQHDGKCTIQLSTIARAMTMFEVLSLSKTLGLIALVDKICSSNDPSTHCNLKS